MTTTATNTANGPERFPRYCYTCTTGMWDGYLCEDNSTVFCTLECAALGLHHHPFGPSATTVEELQLALDVWAESDYRDDVEPPIYWTDWLDIPLSDYDDMPTPDDDPHAEFTDDGAYYPDAMTAELVADGPSGRLSVDADDSDACQLLASVGITLAKGGR